jgi:hypothetical protein
MGCQLDGLLMGVLLADSLESVLGSDTGGFDEGGVVGGEPVAEVEGEHLLPEVAERFNVPLVQVMDAEMRAGVADQPPHLRFPR